MILPDNNTNKSDAIRRAPAFEYFGAIARKIAQNHVTTDNAIALENLLYKLLLAKQQGHSALEITTDTHLHDVPSTHQYTPQSTPEDIYSSAVVAYADKIALSRSFMLEQKIASLLANHIATFHGDIIKVNEATLTELSNAQQAAISRSCQQPVALITGGPGTGKTTIAASIIQQLIGAGISPAQIALTAMTGKAVQRLGESLLRSTLETHDMVLATLHRLLDIRPATAALKMQHQSRALPFKLILVDEASMLDNALLYQLLTRLPSDCRLLFLGDINQLGPIGIGHPFAALSKSLPEQMISTLTQSYRFTEQSIVGNVGISIRDGLLKQAMSTWMQDPEITKPATAFETHVVAAYQHYGTLLNTNATPYQLLKASQQVKILTSHNSGSLGCDSVNQLMDRKFSAISSSFIPSNHYHGQVLMVSRNHPQLHLYNGDIGICAIIDSLPMFITESTESANGYRAIAISELSGLVPAYAITIHKSQGSEYDRVLTALSNHPETPEEQGILNRAMLYTAITRARETVQIFADQQTIEHCIQTTSAPQTLLVPLLHEAMQNDTQ